MGKQFVSFHSMIRGSGKTTYMVHAAKDLGERGYRVLLVDGYIYEVGGLLHRVADIMESVPEWREGCNLYELIRDHELLCSANPKSKKKEIEKLINGLSRSEVFMYQGQMVPEVVSRMRQIPGYERIDFLPGSDCRNMDIKPAIDFEHLYDNQFGCNFFDYLKDSLKAHYDFVLIDAPVGFYTISGILCGQLADLFLAVDVDSRAYQNRPSYEVGLKLAKKLEDSGLVPPRVEAIKGDGVEYLVDLIVGSEAGETT
ncbi:MAG: hypothetical protein GY703_17445 [Gammaproteobacteria bacterium]|nr:hypothetical protein [Gammaproteobacteria bacterium]